MARTFRGDIWAVKAGADLSTHQNKFVMYDANGDAILATAAAKVLGILENSPALGRTADVRISTVGKVIASASITRGAYVASTAAGLAVAATTGEIAGRAMTSAAVNELVEVQVLPILL